MATVDKWVLDHDKTLNTATWLTYEKFDRHCSLLKSSIDLPCMSLLAWSLKLDVRRLLGPSMNAGLKFQEFLILSSNRLQTLHRSSATWSTSVTDYSPIARAFYRMDESVEKQTKRKFDVAYVIAKEGMAFTKMNSLCQLQERHGVRLGECYKNDQACAIFIKYIAQDLQGQLGDSLRKAKFYSIQMDGSTDSGNKEEELFLIVYFEPFSTDVSVHVRNRYLCVRQPNSVCATGLFEAFQRALAYLELDQQPSKLIGFGCDGANVNMGNNGVKGLIQSDRPWVVIIWCLAHRLELAIRDALSHQKSVKN